MPSLWPEPAEAVQAAPEPSSLSTSALLQDALVLALRAFNVGPSELNELEARAHRWSFDSTGNSTDAAVYRGDAQTDVFDWAAVRWRMKGLEEAFGVELIILFALSGLAAILSLAALVLQFRARKQQPKVFWFFRRHYQTQSRIPYIVPHPVNVIVAAMLATSLIVLVYLAFSYDAWNNDLTARAVRIASWFPVIWLTFYAAVWMSGFGSLYLTFLAPSQYTRRGSLTGVQRRISPLVVNAFCYGIPALAYASVMPLQVYQATHMRDAMRKTRALSVSLASLSNDFREEGVRREQIEAFWKQARGTHAAIWEWRLLWRSELGLWSVYTILAMGVAMPLCMFFVLSVHRRVRSMAANQAHQPGLQVDAVGLPAMGSKNSGSFDSSSSEGSQPRKITFDLRTSSAAGPTSLNRLYIPSPVSTTGARSVFTTTPNASNPNSAFGTPSVAEFSSPPFFLTPASSDAHLAKSSLDEPAPQHTKVSKSYYPRSPSLSKPKLQHLRRVSQYAIFPGTSQPQLSGMSEEDKARLSQLNKRYWHVALQYLVVCAVMATICAFALYEASSDLYILTDCRRTNIAVVVVSFIFCILASIWLIANIQRLATQKPVATQRELPASQNHAGPGLGAYTLDKVRRSSPPDVLQLRKPSVLPVDPLEEVEEGLRIEFGEGHSSSRPAYDTRRRSSCRGPSMDFMEALSLPHRPTSRDRGP